MESVFPASAVRVITCLALALLIPRMGAEDAAVQRGGELARKHCVTCHLQPEPEAIDRTTWHDQILPRMKWRLGFSSPQINQSTNVQILRANGRIPLAPVISEAEWMDIAAYYFTNSPTAAPTSPRASVRVGLKHFATTVPPWRHGDPGITMLNASATPGTIWAADEHTGLLYQLDGSGSEVRSFPATNGVASVRTDPRGILVGALGSFQPTDRRLGSAYLLGLEGTNWNRGKDLLANLPRTPDVASADLNGDGRPDLVVCAYGNNLGRFSWFESLAAGGYEEHVLFPLPGALRCEVADFNQDGRPDLAVLVAQETEALFVFVNQGSGLFRRETVFQKPPYFGHTHFEAVDFDKDGRIDLLVSNGDNGEFNSPPKACHGIRLYLNLGNLKFAEALFVPLHGCYRALARDFDGDGDLDIAAVSYFPDFANRPQDGFIYLENTGAMRFAASTFREVLSGRWVTLDAGDIDGDGDLDLVLGSYIHGPREVPLKVMEGWVQANLPMMILKNTTR